ncbi:DMT family transporter [Candidatus Micrarchaeota archaeon]|nr:DMT family transporter [Candidatus Micrarchaeota archaeon]
MKQQHPLFFVLASAVLYGLGIPLAKLLLSNVQPVLLAGLLYLGAAIGLTIFSFFGGVKKEKKTNMNQNDVPWLAGVVIFGGILAPILLMLGLSQVSGVAASLLLNLEGVATALVASIFFREFTGKRFWVALAAMTIAGVLLSWSGNGTFSLLGPAYILLAVFFWGLDNNFTNKITTLEPLEITKIKCFFAGVINIAMGIYLGAGLTVNVSLLYAMIVGTFNYGVSIVLFIYALRGWGAARTGAFFSVAPFIGAIASILLLKENINWSLLPAFVLMAFGTWLIISEKHSHGHYHGKTYHVHEHHHDEEHQHEH